MRKPWKPGDLCPDCERPLWAESDKYKPGRNTCRPCGLEKRRTERREAILKEGLRCAACDAILGGNDKRYGRCKPCRDKAVADANAARKCPCGASIAHRSLNARFCERCTNKARVNGAKAGNVAARAKQRELREATRGPVDTPRPVAQAWPGLRGSGGEWEKGPTTVQGWAALDGGRL